jgi:serine/threonine protein kinase
MMSPHYLQDQKYACEDPPPLKLDFVRVGGQYRLRNLLGSGGSGESNSAVVSHFSDTSLGSVYLGRDIRTGADVAIKIGYPGVRSSRLVHEYQVYTRIAGCAGTCSVLWYGKEDSYEVMVLDYLGKSLDNLIDEEKPSSGKAFCFASQMVCS